MALDYWKLNGLTSSFNPLTTSFSNGVNKINDLPIGSWTVNFYAYSPTNQPIGLKLDSISNTYVVDQPLTTNRKFYTFTFNNPADQTFYIKGFSPSSTDIVIDSIQVVKTPLPKLTINGVDGFLSGKWSLNTTSTAQDDQTLIINPTGTWQTSWLNNLSVIPNQTYTFSNIGGTGNAYIYYPNGSGTLLATITVGNSGTFTVPSGQNTISIGLSNGTNATSQVTFKQPMLNLGSVPAPYSPKTGDRMVMPFAKNNLLPPLSKVSNQLLNNAVITGDHSLSLSVSDAPSYHSSYFSIPVVSGKTYTVSGVTNDPNACIRVHAGIGFSGALVGGIINSNSSSYFSFIADDSFNGYASVRLDNNGANGTFNFNSLQVVEGTVPFGIAQENKLPQKYVPKKNLFDGQMELGYIDPTTGNNVAYSTRTRSVNYLTINGNTSYYLSTPDNELLTDFRVMFYDSNKSFISSFYTYISSGNYSYSFTTPTNCKYIRFTNAQSTNTFARYQIEQGSTATPYEPYTLVLPPSNKGLSFNTIGQSDFVNLAINFDEFEIDFIYQFNSLSSYPTLLTLGAQSSLVPFYWLYSDVLGRINLQATNGTNYTTNALPYNFINGQRYLIHIKHVSDGFDVYINGLYFKFSGSYLVPTSSSCYLMCYPGIHFNQGTLNSFKTWKNGSIVAQYDFTQQNNIVGTTIMQNAQNLIPSFEDSGWSIHANAKVMGKDVLHLDATASSQSSNIVIPVIEGKTYLFNGNVQNGAIFRLNRGSVWGASLLIGNGSFTVPSGVTSVYVNLYNNSATTGSFDFIRPQLYQLDGTEGTINGSPVQLNKPSKRSLYAKR